MTTTIAQIQQGEGCTITLTATTGDPTGYACRVALKRATAGRGVPPTSTPELIVIMGVASNDTGKGKPGWLIPLTAAQSAGLATGDYVIDAKLTKNAIEPLITDAVCVQIQPSVNSQ